MENQHRRIKGYRELSQAEIDLMNEIKAEGLVLEALVKKAREHIESQRIASFVGDEDDLLIEERNRLLKAEPELWAALGKTHFQEGLMALTRSVAQPTSF